MLDKKRFLLLCAPGMLAFSVLAHTGLAAAASVEDIHAQLEQKRAAQTQLAGKAKKIGAEVSALQRRLVATGGALRGTEDDLSKTDDSLNKLQAQKAQAVRKLYADQQALGGFVSAAQKYSRSTTPDILVKEKPLEAARAALVMKAMIPTLNRHEADLRDELDKLAALEKDISAQRKKQSGELDKLKDQQASLDKLLQERRNVYRHTENSRKEQERAVARLAKEAKTLEDLVNEMRPERPRTASRTAARSVASPSLASMHLPPSTLLPVSGTVHTAFGQKDDMGGKSMGITFNTRPGATVVTPLSGVVKFAGPFQKYKQILIVEHQGGYHSLIAGLGRIDTVVGATLAAGEPVGVASSSTDDARIYYELRQNGDPINPRKLLVAQRKQDKS